MTTKIKNIFYRVNGNMGETIQFYEDVLGLSLQFNDRDQWAQFKLVDVTFALGGEEEVPDKLEANAVVTFEVENIEKMKTLLEEKGCWVSEIRDMGSHGSTCYFFDPATNIVQLYQK